LEIGIAKVAEEVFAVRQELVEERVGDLLL
jgi:hypothetical protein